MILYRRDGRGFVPVIPDYDTELDAQDLVELLEELLGYAEAYSQYLTSKWEVRERTEAWIYALGVGEETDNE